MITTMIPVQLPESLFQRLKRTAELTHHSVQELAAITLEAALPLVPEVPPEIAHELTAMHLFSDEALWAATAPSLSPTEETRLTQLNSAATKRALTRAEQAEQHGLIAAYHRSVLRRAKALALLAQRGHQLPLTPESSMNHGECVKS
jgi:hypothetical protein